MSFTTTPGASATDATSYLGTSGADSIDITNSSVPTYTGGRDGTDTIRYDNDAKGEGASNHTIKGGKGKDVVTAINTTASLASGFINLNQDDDQGTFNAVTKSTIYGGAGIDTLSVGSLASSIFNANKGNDLIETFGTAASSVFGGAGEDTLNIRGGNDDSIIRGDNDNDVINLLASTTYSSNTINGNAGNDSITVNAITSFTNSNILGGAGNDTLNGATATVALNLAGSNGNDIVTGGTVADTLLGEVGSDTITGNAGTDSLTGGGGIDHFAYTAVGQGGASVAVANGLAAGDTITDFGGGSTDKISIAAASWIGSGAAAAAGAQNAWDIGANAFFILTGQNLNYQAGTTTGANVSTVVGTIANGQTNDVAYVAIQDTTGTNEYNIFQYTLKNNRNGAAIANNDEVAHVATLTAAPTLVAGDIVFV
ncbi:beta strand repeat-containing protein [Prochlorococcus marinus]|uniref:beta strand repeat-containing protein n=1 Tax=Prochlorococcus TaxID=1218 RepID=UPI0007B33490|nr:calcium-binding protein [Prochlorococcus marinus]KZR78334.1 Poly(beta-D-mannuronate) C5 epimerase 7 [Prochlorococcus marinus str. MIT 1323]